MNSLPPPLYSSMALRERYERRSTDTFPTPFGDCYDENSNPTLGLLQPAF